MPYRPGLHVDRWGFCHVPTVAASGVRVASLVLCREDEHGPINTWEVVKRLTDAGLLVIGRFARESLRFGGVDLEWDEALHQYARMVGPDLWAICAGNEYSNAGPASWSMSAVQQSLLHRLAAEAFRAVNPDIAVISGPVGTGQPEDVAALDLGPCDMVGFNAYDMDVYDWEMPGWVLSRDPQIDAHFAGGWGPLRGLLAGMHGVAGSRPLAVMEWGYTNPATAPAAIRGAASVLNTSPYDVGVACHFRYSDQRYWGEPEPDPGAAGMGLFDADGRETPRWAAFRDANRAILPDQEVPIMPTLDELQAQVAALEAKLAGVEGRDSLQFDLFARILSGNWDEGAGSAEGLLRAISDKYKGFNAVPFPKE